MNNYSIIRILRESSLLLKHEFDASSLRFVEINNRVYADDVFLEFKRDLIEAGSKIRILFMEQSVPANGLVEFMNKTQGVVLVFSKTQNNLQPYLLFKAKNELKIASLADEAEVKTNSIDTNFDFSNFYGDAQGLIAFVIYPYQSLVSEYEYDGYIPTEKISPVRRFLRLLSTEKKNITYILFYSVIIGLTGLVLPVGIQNTVELISGGVFFSSIYILIVVVILGVLFTGILQIVQISLVEYLQRRVFTKAALEFAFRIPRIKVESILNNYAPELVNRFFDVITLQKGLPKLLIDLTSSGIQIFFGLILLSLYHPFFVVFSLILVLVLFLIFWFTGPTGLRSSINESKYKYKVAQWLEELARAINSFKLAGNTDLPIRRADNTVSNYLKHRKAHFSVLVTQFSFIVVFKTLVTASLLIMGTTLVVNREITLGQFVAAEVIIILILNAVEKTIMYMDVMYDLFTAVDKISQITDLPLEKVGGLDFPSSMHRGYSLEMKNLKFRYSDKADYALSGINLQIKSGERICIAGPGNAGKSTLANVIAGFHTDYEGVLTINNYSLRDLDITHLRDRIAKNISADDIFDGTILENITLGSATRTVDDALAAIRIAHLEDEVNSLPEGLNTHLVSGGKGFSSTFIHKLILARCLAKKPSLIILNDFFSGIKRQDKIRMLESVMNSEMHFTVVAISNDPLIMSACDRVIVLNEGMVAHEGTFAELMKGESMKNYIE